MTKILNGVAKHMFKIAIIIVICLVLFPMTGQSSYVLRIVTVCMMYVMIAMSINLLTGFCGLMTMGHAAFWGIGAYTAAILSTRYNVGMGVCMILAAVIAGIFSLLLGLATLRLKGYFLTIVTLGFCEIIRLVELNSMELTRGPLGIANIPAPNFFGVTFSSTNAVYYIMLILVVLTVLLVYNFVHSRIGLAVMSIRDDDLAAASMGVNVYLYKIMVFVISAMIMGVCGAFYAHYIKFVDPSSFTTNASMQMLIMAIFGGLGSIPGTILGASILTILPETIRVLSQYRNLIYGIIIVVLMMVKPDGLLGSVNFKYIKQRLMLKKEKQHEKGAANE
ncbi:MAG: branched-chain amino acid ABC transporter permease [Candidatus Alectryocaccobium sp.]|jgi:branched-chain amino acid transport system permease protein|nr:branched-chain amino acid ABC transporter permease [Candidatus Alectryocaccobium sp.]